MFLNSVSLDVQCVIPCDFSGYSYSVAQPSALLHHKVVSGHQPEDTVKSDFSGDFVKICSKNFFNEFFSLIICMKIFFIWFVVLIDSEFSRNCARLLSASFTDNEM